MGIDATTLEANAAMRSIVRRDSGETYDEYLCGLAKASGIDTPSREDVVRLDRKRKKHLEQGMEEPGGWGRTDCEDEGWTDALGAQGGARRGHGHGCYCGGDAAGRRPGGYEHFG